MSSGTGFSELDSAVVWIGAITVVLGALGVVWRWSKGIRRVAVRFDQFADDWQGTEERPGVPARPGVMERLASFDDRLYSVDARVVRIEHELHPNSGSSMRDAIDRVERHVGSA